MGPEACADILNDERPRFALTWRGIYLSAGED